MKLRSAYTPLLVGAVLLGACSGGMEMNGVEPVDIPALEAAVEAQPADVNALTHLGVAYYNAGRHSDAVAALRRAIGMGSAEPVAHLYLGLAYEATEDWQEASDAYVAFLAAPPRGSDLRDDIENRVALVERELMEQQLEAMLAQEEALASQPAQPRTVAVFPFRVVADDPRYEPLQFALADMVTTDLGIPGSLQLLERAQIQALVQEMALSLAGFTDAASGARVGRLMRAEHVVQGSVVLLDEERLRMEMAVVDPAQAAREGEAADETQLEQIFESEKQLVMELFGVLGITLTASEREAIEENRTGSILALLSYGEGLAAMDRGDYGAANASFERAVEIDPGFQAAQVRVQESAGLQDAASTSGSEIAAAAAEELPDAGTQVAVANDLLDAVAQDVNPTNGDSYDDAAPQTDDLNAPPIDDANSGAGATIGGIRVPIVIDNPNVE
jgi:tetratricopeptide (TPR) repeat protein